MKLQEYTASAHNFEECMKCTICTAYCPVVQMVHFMHSSKLCALAVYSCSFIHSLL